MLKVSQFVKLELFVTMARAHNNDVKIVKHALTFRTQIANAALNAFLTTIKNAVT